MTVANPPDRRPSHPYPVPKNEAERLEALRLARILDTAAEKAFDDLVQLAAAVCETPIAVVSLVDASRQWFKAKVGLEQQETSRDIAFCAHAILGKDIMVVGDATKDPRFCGNPLVTGDPNIRFYAGAPIVLDGDAAIGTVCVIDRKPRELTPMQQNALGVIQRMAGHLIELRRARLDLEAVSQLLPMCSWCRSVKTAKGEWTDLHRYVASAMPVTHSMCPACVQREMHSQSPQTR